MHCTITYIRCCVRHMTGVQRDRLIHGDIPQDAEIRKNEKVVRLYVPELQSICIYNKN